MEVTDGSPFIPLCVFLHAIRGEKSIDFPWIKNSTESQFAKVLNLVSFPVSKDLPTSNSLTEIRFADIGNNEEVLLRKPSNPYPINQTPPTPDHLRQTPSPTDILLLRKMEEDELNLDQKQLQFIEEEEERRKRFYESDDNNMEAQQPQ